MKFEHCVRCTICVENCPIFKMNPEYPGPKQAGPDAQRFRLDGEATIDEWVRLCSQCKRCEIACPYGVDVSEIILRAQLNYSREHSSPFASHLFANAYYVGILCSSFAPIVNRVVKWPVTQGVMNILGISTHLPFPEYRFLTLGRSRKRKGRGDKKVVFFYGCHLNFNRPDIGRKIRDLLVSLGCRVEMPPQTCCGLPALGNGDIEIARRFASKNAATLAEYIDKGYDVVYACTSCGLTLTHDYPGILELPEGKKIAENTYNVHEYILNLIEEGYADPEFGPVEKTIAYHIPCHLRALGIGYPASRLFEMIPGLECRILDDNCCGLSGSYGFKKKNRDTAVKLGKIAASAINETGAESFVSDCGACRMQLTEFSNMQALDPSEILVESMINSDSSSAAKKRSLL